MVETLLKVLLKGLSLWEHHEKTKYRDRVLKLKKDWYEEHAKPQDIRSDVVLDTIERELRFISEQFATAPLGSQHEDIQGSPGA